VIATENLAPAGVLVHQNRVRRTPEALPSVIIIRDRTMIGMRDRADRSDEILLGAGRQGSATAMRGFSAVVTGVVLLTMTVSVIANSMLAAATPATGLIAGSVDDITSGAPVAGVCVYAYAVSGQPGSLVATGTPYQAVTEGDGSYEVTVPLANYVVEFDPSCGGAVSSPYALQYYVGQVDLADASLVFASAISPATGIDAHLVAGYTISGTATEAGGTGGGAKVCASADVSAGHPVSSVKSAADGTYAIGNLPAGTYTVYFDPTCGATQASTYAQQYYEAAPDIKTATGVVVTADVTGIDADLVAGGTISGTVTAAGALDEAGICVYTIGADGNVAERAFTRASGAYRVANLAAQTYNVAFDPTCRRSHSSYFASVSYYRQIALNVGQTVLGINGALPLEYGPTLSIIRASLDPGVVASPYCETVSLTGPDQYGDGYTANATGLPPGLSLSAVEASRDEGITGGSQCQEVGAWGPSVLGYPKSAGAFKVTVTVTTVDSAPNLVATRTFDIVISASRVSISSSSATLSGSYLPIKLTCEHTRAGVYDAAPGGACSGSATVAAKAAVLAAGSYLIANGKSAVVKLVLTATGLKALANAKVHAVKERLTVTLNGRQGKSAVLLIS